MNLHIIPGVGRREWLHTVIDFHALSRRTCPIIAHDVVQLRRLVEYSCWAFFAGWVPRLLTGQFLLGLEPCLIQ